MPGYGVDGRQLACEFAAMLGRRSRVAHNTTGSTTANKFFYDEIGFLEILAGRA
jgi:hypothetical protein